METQKKLNPSLPVLLVDDDDVVLQNYKLLLRSAGINNVTLCHDSREVMPLLAKNDYETIILDLMMPYISGEELLEQLKKEFPAVPVIVVTAVDDTDTVVRCIKNKASDFLVKPVTRSRLITSLKNTLKIKELERERNSLRDGFLFRHLNHPETFSDFNTRSEKMQSLFLYMEVIAHSSEPVLITGETGSGKELVAKALNKLCQLPGKFVTVNVAGLDDHLFTDTLFGHMKGAFTDAVQPRKGLVEQAAEGILFLDEIGDLSMPSQVKLLRLIQEKEYYPLGADVPRRSNARIIVATNKNPEELQQSGKFRKDLYYRLCVHHIHVPSLKERKQDIPLLADHFLEEASKELEKKKPTAPEELYTLLSTYHFPGNIRELRAMVYNAVSTHTSKKMSMNAFKQAIKVSRENTNNSTVSPDTPYIDINNQPQPKIQFSQQLPTLKESQEILVQEAMNRAKNNQSIAAQILGITRQALNRRLKEMPKSKT